MYNMLILCYVKYKNFMKNWWFFNGVLRSLTGCELSHQSTDPSPLTDVKHVQFSPFIYIICHNSFSFDNSTAYVWLLSTISYFYFYHRLYCTIMLSVRERLRAGRQRTIIYYFSNIAACIASIVQRVLTETFKLLRNLWNKITNRRFRESW